jgi:hypothetical protein
VPLHCHHPGHLLLQQGLQLVLVQLVQLQPQQSALF